MFVIGTMHTLGSDMMPGVCVNITCWTNFMHMIRRPAVAESIWRRIRDFVSIRTDQSPHSALFEVKALHTGLVRLRSHCFGVGWQRLALQDSTETMPMLHLRVTKDQGVYTAESLNSIPDDSKVLPGRI